MNKREKIEKAIQEVLMPSNKEIMSKLLATEGSFGKLVDDLMSDLDESKNTNFFLETFAKHGIKPLDFGETFSEPIEYREKKGEKNE